MGMMKNLSIEIREAEETGVDFFVSECGELGYGVWDVAGERFLGNPPRWFRSRESAEAVARFRNANERNLRRDRLVQDVRDANAALNAFDAGQVGR